jgi:hypothetical protein
MTKRASIPRLPTLPEQPCRRQVYTTLRVAKQTVCFLLKHGLQLQPYKCRFCERIHLTGW